MSDESAARKARTSTLFDRLAPDYDRGGDGCFAHFGRHLVAAASVAPGERILDVACGRGAILLPATERVGPTGEIIGIDLSPAMVAAANDEAIRRGLPSRALVMDAEHLDFPAATFDCVLCGFGLMFFPDPARALGEFRRVLKPGGRLGLSTWRAPESHNLGVILTRLGFPNPIGTVTQFKEPADLARLLSQSSYTNIEVHIDAHTFRYANLEDYWQTARGTGMRIWLDSLTPDQTVQARAALADHLRPHHRDDGISLEASAVLALARR